jgi:porphobilinogen synthase
LTSAKDSVAVANRKFPARRTSQRSEFSRRLVRETELSTNDLIYPMFVVDGKGQR